MMNKRIAMLVAVLLLCAAGLLILFRYWQNGPERERVAREQEAQQIAQQESNAAADRRAAEAAREATEVAARRVEEQATHEQHLREMAEIEADTVRVLREADHATKHLVSRISSSPSRRDAPSVGYVGSIQTDAAATAAEMIRYNQFMLANDASGMRSMEADGSIWWHDGMVRIIQVAEKPSSPIYYCEVRFLDGPRAETIGWISTLSVPGSAN